MDIWLYYEATHRYHTFCNPISSEKVNELGRVLGLDPGARVLDVGCGHAEFLLRWIEQYGIAGVGVDLSPYFVARARKNKEERAPDADLEILEMGGADYEAPEPFDVSMCIGASWIWNGFAGTLDALLGYTKPGGLIVSGEPYWIAEAPDEFLKAEGIESRDQFHTLDTCRTMALERGLDTVWMIASSHEDWDRYEMYQTAAMDRFARENPDHPDLDELRERRRCADEAYLRWGRACLGFAIWVFRVPA